MQQLIGCWSGASIASGSTTNLGTYESIVTAHTYAVTSSSSLIMVDYHIMVKHSVANATFTIYVTNNAGLTAKAPDQSPSGFEFLDLVTLPVANEWFLFQHRAFAEPTAFQKLAPGDYTFGIYIFNNAAGTLSWAGESSSTDSWGIEEAALLTVF